jgi:hypothetical protein
MLDRSAGLSAEPAREVEAIPFLFEEGTKGWRLKERRGRRAITD